MKMRIKNIRYKKDWKTCSPGKAKDSKHKSKKDANKRKSLKKIKKHEKQ